MDRRDFLKKAFLAAAAVTVVPILEKTVNFQYKSSRSTAYSQEKSPAFDMAAVVGGEPDKMFDEAIKALGGMTSFVKKNNSVVIKPNIGWDVAPERGANTNPLLVSRIVKHCVEAGAKEVLVFDNTCDNWKKSYKNSGIEQAVEAAGGKMVPANSEKYYQNVDNPDAKVLKKMKVHELVLGSDVFINVPVLKSHDSAGLTISMKNMMGVVYDRWYWHRNNLQQCIADFPLFKKPTLNVVDAYRVLMSNGPRGTSATKPDLKKTLIISPDIVASDAAAAKVFGAVPESIAHIRLASQAGIGEINLEKLKISRIKM